MISTSIEMLLYGETSGRKNRGRVNSSPTIISYNDIYKRDSRRGTVRVPGHHNCLKGIVFEDRGEANDVLEGLIDLAEEYSQVTIADFYELAGLDDRIEFTVNKWGWERGLNRARIIRTKDGWEIDLPKPIELD